MTKRHTHESHPHHQAEAHEAAAEDAAKAQEAAEEAEEAKKNAAADADAEPVAEDAAPAADAPAEPPAADEEPAPSEADILKDRLLRLQADFDNYKKRQLRERQDWIASANADILRELLPVLDNFERGLQSATATPENQAIVEGFSMIFDQLKALLGKFDVAEVPTDGQPFDPAVHEAITTMPSADIPEGHIVTAARRGYTLAGKLLRAAQVVVSSGPADAPAADAAQ